MDKILVIDEPLPSVYLLDFAKATDNRGFFSKPYHIASFKQIHPDFSVAEYFYSRSYFNVIRGMHYQLGSSPSQKLIFCSAGAVLDVVVDVRKDSKNYNKPVSFTLSEHQPTALFVGRGYAHGYLTLTDHADLHYLCDSLHDPSDDKGVLWSSINFDWPTSSPILSQRDKMHLPI